MAKFGNLLRRCRPRFGLRTLLLAVTVLCVWLAAEVERWRGEVAALREIHYAGFSTAYVRAWWGEEREVAGPGDLRPWETVVRTDHTVVDIDRLESILLKLPNTRNIGFDRANTAEEYRTLIDLQHKYKNVDINWEICGYFPHVSWCRVKRDGSTRSLTELQLAEREFFQLKGWNTSYMWLPHEKRSPSKTE